MTEEKKKGFFGSLFAPKKSKGCCCGVQFEEIPKEEVNGKKTETAQAENKDQTKEDKPFGVGDCCR